MGNRGYKPNGRVGRFLFDGLILAGILSTAATVHAAAVAPQSLPLLQPTDVEYLGSFALPTETVGTSRFGYGGEAITPYYDSVSGKQTLFICGHVQNPGQVAQVEVPDNFVKSYNYADLPVAKFAQPFVPVAIGQLEALSGVTTTNGTHVYGMLAYHSRLIVASGEYYGCTQKTSHGVSTLNLATGHDFKGFFKLTAGANVSPRALGGPMTPVPAEWQSLLGGPVLTGNWAIPVVSCNSAGPSVTVFNPDDLGVKSTVVGSTLLFYPITATTDHALCTGVNCSNRTPEATQNDVFNLATHYAGLAFPSGSRSLLLFGRVGTGPYCYSTADVCKDPVELDNKGPHAYPYRYQVWAYDMNDLLAVKSGKKQTYDPKPYGMWPVDILDGFLGVGRAETTGAGYDPVTRRMYVTLLYGEQPHVDVFQIRTPAVDVRAAGKAQGAWRISARQDAVSAALTLDVPGYSGPALRYAVFDNRGREVARVQSAGAGARAVWEAAGRRSGIYFVRAEVRGQVLIERVALTAAATTTDLQ